MLDVFGLPMFTLIAQAVDDASKARLQGSMLLGLALALGLIGLLVVVGLLYAWRKSVNRVKRKPGATQPAADAWAVAGQRFEGDAEAGEHGVEAGGGDDATDPLEQRGQWLAGDPSEESEDDAADSSGDQDAEPDTGLDVDAGPKTYDTGIHFDDGYKDDTGPDTGENWKADTEYEEDEDDEIDQVIAESQAITDDDPFTAYREPPDELKGLFEDQDDEDSQEDKGNEGDEDETTDEDDEGRV